METNDNVLQILSDHIAVTETLLADHLRLCQELKQPLNPEIAGLEVNMQLLRKRVQAAIGL